MFILMKLFMYLIHHPNMLIILVTKVLIESQTFCITPGMVLGSFVGLCVGPIDSAF